MFKDQLVRYRVIYDRKKQAAKKGKALVQIEAYQNGIRRYFNTGIYLKPDEWNAKKQEPKDSFAVSEIRAFITDLEAFEKKHRYFNGEKFTLKDFDRLTDQRDRSQSNALVLTFNQFFDEQLFERRKELRPGTYRNHKACLNTLNEYNPAIRFEDMDYKLIDGFHQFMIAKGHKHFTWHKRHVQLKTYLRKAVKRGLINRNPYEDYQVATPRADIVPLIMDEVRLLESLTFPPGEKRKERVRDMFLFSIYTGLRWSDVSRLTKDHFTQSKDGLVLEIKSAKENKTLKLPLQYLFDGKAEPIARKYWPDQDGAKLFKGIYNAFANLRLKEIAAMAGIKKNLHFHISRHTACTIIAKKTDVLVAQGILQHSKLSTTQAYLHLSNAERDEAIKNVKDWN